MRALLLSMAAATLVAGALTAPAHAAASTAGPASAAAVSSSVPSSGSSTGTPSGASVDARKVRQKKLRLHYTITPFGGAYQYTWQVTTKRGVPVRGVVFHLQYKPVPHKWHNEGAGSRYVSDANGQFTYIGCNVSFGLQRMYSKATKRHKAIARTFRLRDC